MSIIMEIIENVVYIKNLNLWVQENVQKKIKQNNKVDQKKNK